MKPAIAGLTLFLVGSFLAEAATAQARHTTVSGRVQRVWEDGFQLSNEKRSIVVDADDLCRDHTNRHITVGENVTVVGEFDDGELDAFSITRSNVQRVCM